MKPIENHRGGTKMEILFFLGVLGVWVILQIWVLPRFGIQT